MGGKNAISPAPAIAASGRTWRSIDSRADHFGILERVGILLVSPRRARPSAHRPSSRLPADRSVPPSCPRARAPRRNRQASRVLLAQVMQPGLQIIPPRIDGQQAPRATTASTPIKVIAGQTASPASPAIRKPTATSCNVVFHLASRVTGTLTRNSARYSRKPETRISRQRMTIAGEQRPAVNGVLGRKHEQAGR